MRYNQIRECDIANGEGIGVALFVQGCRFKCKNCFNPETWDFNGGKEWTPEVEDKLIELANRPYIKRLSILGGEPLADENLDGVLHLVNRFRLLFPNKSIWIYTGYTLDEIFKNDLSIPAYYMYDYMGNDFINNEKRKQIISQCSIMVDGRYVDSQRNPSKKWAGSDNQRVIDIKQSLQKGEVILWTD